MLNSSAPTTASVAIIQHKVDICLSRDAVSLGKVNCLRGRCGLRGISRYAIADQARGELESTLTIKFKIFKTFSVERGKLCLIILKNA